MEAEPESYREICSGSTFVKLACYPDQDMLDARIKYSRYINEKYSDENVPDIEVRAFQVELLRTLGLVFKNDFED